jgi:nucleotide-binding universal stress UspA family protein
MTTRTVLVGVDGSPGSNAAVRWCARYAVALDADVVAVHALTPMLELGAPVMGADLATPYDDGVRRSLEGALDQWCKPLHEAGVTVRAEVVRTAEEVHADLVVVGRRGHGGFRELLLGSVPHQLTHHCNQAVVVVPPEPEASEADA